jgi:hypothetical protein
LLKARDYIIAVEELRLYISLYIAGISEITEPLKTWSNDYKEIKSKLKSKESGHYYPKTATTVKTKSTKEHNKLSLKLTCNFRQFTFGAMQTPSSSLNLVNTSSVKGLVIMSAN